MFEGTHFTTRCVIQVDEETRSTNGITVTFLYMKSCNDRNEFKILNSSPRVNFTFNEEDYANNWIVAVLTITNVTVNDSGCYSCLAISYGYTETDDSNVIFVKSM